MLRYLPYLLLITLWIYAFVDCLGTPEREVRGLPKVVWLLIILFFGEILLGPLGWLLVGKRRVASAYPQTAYGRAGEGQFEDEQPQKRGQFIAPDDNPEFLRSLSELIKQKREDGTSPSEGE